MLLPCSYSAVNAVTGNYIRADDIRPYRFSKEEMMANKIKGLTIQIGADTLGLDKALSSIETASRKATSELKEIERAISKVPDSAELWKQKNNL